MSISGSDRPIKWRCAGTSLRDTALSYAPLRMEYTLTELTKKKKKKKIKKDCNFFASVLVEFVSSSKWEFI